MNFVGKHVKSIQTATALIAVSALLYSCADTAFRNPAGQHEGAPEGGVERGEVSSITRGDYYLINYADLSSETEIFAHAGEDHPVLVKLKYVSGVDCYVKDITGKVTNDPEATKRGEFQFRLSRDSKLFCRVADARLKEVTQISAQFYSYPIRIQGETVEQQQPELLAIHNRIKAKDYSSRDARAAYSVRGFMRRNGEVELNASSHEVVKLGQVKAGQVAYFSGTGNISLTGTGASGAQSYNFGPNGVDAKTEFGARISGIKGGNWMGQNPFSTLCFYGSYQDFEVKLPFRSRTQTRFVRGEMVNVGLNGEPVEIKKDGDIYCEIDSRDLSRDKSFLGWNVNGGMKVAMQVMNPKVAEEELATAIATAERDLEEARRQREEAANSFFRATVQSRAADHSKSSAQFKVAFEKRKSDDIEKARLKRIADGEADIWVNNSATKEFKFTASKISHAFFLRPTEVVTKDDDGKEVKFTDWVLHEGPARYKTEVGGYLVDVQESVWGTPIAIVSRDPWDPKAKEQKLEICVNRINDFKDAATKLTKVPGKEEFDKKPLFGSGIAEKWPPTGEFIRKTLASHASLSASDNCRATEKAQEVTFKRVPEYEFCYEVKVLQRPGADGRSVVGKLHYYMKNMKTAYRSEQLPNVVFTRNYGEANLPGTWSFLWASDESTRVKEQGAVLQHPDYKKEIVGTLIDKKLKTVPKEVCIKTEFVKPSPTLEEIEAKILADEAKTTAAPMPAGRRN